MDHRIRVYYLINLNQNHNRSGWWSNGWDNFGSRYDLNLDILRSEISSLKITPNNQTKYPDYYQMKISLKRDEEELLINVLSKLKDVDYIKLLEVK